MPSDLHIRGASVEIIRRTSDTERLFSQKMAQSATFVSSSSLVVGSACGWVRRVVGWVGLILRLVLGSSLFSSSWTLTRR